jgi:hypothetical protein
MISCSLISQLKSKCGLLMWVVFSLVLLAVFSYSIFFSGPNYYDGAIGNLMATICGIVLGVPAAISISHWRDKIEQSKAMRDAETKRDKILQLLLDELRHNKRILSKRLALEDKKYPHPELKFIGWHAFSNSGEIRWLDDPALLDHIANAYHYIQLLNADEEIWYKAEIERDPRQSWKAPGDRIREHIVKIYPDADKVVTQTIKVIEEYLSYSMK